MHSTSTRFSSLENPPSDHPLLRNPLVHTASTMVHFFSFSLYMMRSVATIYF